MHQPVINVWRKPHHRRHGWLVLLKWLQFTTARSNGHKRRMYKCAWTNSRLIPVKSVRRGVFLLYIRFFITFSTTNIYFFQTIHWILLLCLQYWIFPPNRVCFTPFFTFSLPLWHLLYVYPLWVTLQCSDKTTYSKIPYNNLQYLDPSSDPYEILRNFAIVRNPSQKSNMSSSPHLFTEIALSVTLVYKL